MKKSLLRRIEKQIEEEQKTETNYDLLDKLRKFASEGTTYWEFEADDRNALNSFFVEVKDLMLEEILTGSYGSNIILDSMFVLCFEVGYKLGAEDRG